MAPTCVKDVSKSVSMKHGELYVTQPGPLLMLELPADSLVTSLSMPHPSTMLGLVLDLAESCWTTFCVTETRRDLWTVPIVDLEWLQAAVGTVMTPV